MSGHSKWKNIKHKKKYIDNIKSKKYSKINKIIYNMIKNYNIKSNIDIEIKHILSSARLFNFPLNTVRKNINKYIQNTFNCNILDVYIEIYCPYNVVILLELYDKNIIENKIYIKKKINKLSLRYSNIYKYSNFFEKKIILCIYKLNKINIDNFSIKIIDNDIDDLLIKNKKLFIIFNIKKKKKILSILKNKNIKNFSYKISFIAKKYIKLNSKCIKEISFIINEFKLLDNIHYIYNNFNIYDNIRF